MPTRILVVDDDIAVCDCVTQMLSQNGCMAESVCNARDALARLAEESFDLVLTDDLMRGMSGRQLAALIKTFYPGTPIILLTGCFPSRAIEEVDCIVLKPFSSRKLWATIGEVLLRVLTQVPFAPDPPPLPCPQTSG